MFAEQRLQQIQSWVDADQESLPPELRTLVQDGERLTVPFTLMDADAALSKVVFEDSLARRTLELRGRQGGRHGRPRGAGPRDAGRLEASSRAVRRAARGTLAACRPDDHGGRYARERPRRRHRLDRDRLAAPAR